MNIEWASEGDRKSSKLPSMEDGARTLREKRAAYVGMQEWASQDVKRGGTAGFWNLSRQSSNCRDVFLIRNQKLFRIWKISES